MFSNFVSEIQQYPIENLGEREREIDMVRRKRRREWERERKEGIKQSREGDPEKTFSSGAWKKEGEGCDHIQNDIIIAL